ncbi:MAG TPA: hypothetical protein PLV06_08640 [Bacteroidales bacterium]|nr:hypothetical protein [Bacteroidales bacterium]HPF03296.1 hypothetical protein [Bacteroidales bacterium]HPJ58091.1 hypothetical protein [Bacteroidales bacterium]HPR12436.1 hypothetical protein [Bacteroidales bacterium]HRW84501.1 hypothetical protein [Bacteroidales bacterium]
MNLSKFIIITVVTLLFGSIAPVSGQAVPGVDENIPFLVTFGRQGETSWGDDDFYQVWFFSIPQDFNQQFYIRVFDPDCGGEHDEIQGEFNSRTQFSVYGGAGVDPDANEESKGLLKGMNYKGGTLLASRVFGGEPVYDNKYYTFGPFNPTSGDLNNKWKVRLFKVVIEGIAGDDGNLYRFFMSRNPDNDVPVEGGNAFTYEYTFRMWNNTMSVSHIYPYVDTGVIFIRQKNFDWDDDGHILVVSRYKQGINATISNEDNWEESRITIDPLEIGASLDFQFHKKQTLVKNNNVVITTENQYGEAMPFYSTPIGGVPVYQPRVGVTKIPKPKG